MAAKCDIFVLIKTYVFYDHKNQNQKVISNMIQSEDNAENKIYLVILSAILKNANLGTFSKDIFCKLFFSVKCMF